VNPKLKVLVVEDNKDDALLIIEALRDSGWQPVWQRVETTQDLREALRRETWDLVTTDYQMPELKAPGTLQVLRESGYDIPCIVISGSIGEEEAVALMREGADDFFLKNNLARLPAAVERELREAENRHQRRAAEEQVRQQARELAAKNEELARKNEELAAANRELDFKAQQLYRSNVDLERFAYVASHDLSEPLRSVASYSQMLIRHYEQGRLGEAEAREFIGYIRSGIHRMHQLLQGLLTYSRVMHDPDRQFAPVDTNQVLEEVMASLQQAISETGAVITWERLPTVIADRTQLVQVFQNLIANSLKYHRQGVPPEVRITAEKKADEILFGVEDNGIGIDPAYWERVFVIFKRLHHERDYPGTGVGLALAKRLVERHGGRIWVESQPGVGSTFRFSLPRIGARSGEPSSSDAA
jgi:signal transduction histidine kinase